MRTKKFVLMALLCAMALGLYALESMIPPVGIIPGAKLGLANIITMTAFYILGRKEAFTVLLVRILVSSVLFGHLMSMMYSAAGGILSFLALCICDKFIKRHDIWAMGIICALFHNLGQIAVAVAVTGQIYVAYYFLLLVLVSMVSGLFTGVCAGQCVSYAEKIIKTKHMR